MLHMDVCMHVSIYPTSLNTVTRAETSLSRKSIPNLSISFVCKGNFKFNIFQFQANYKSLHFLWSPFSNYNVCCALVATHFHDIFDPLNSTTKCQIAPVMVFTCFNRSRRPCAMWSDLVRLAQSTTSRLV